MKTLLRLFLGFVPALALSAFAGITHGADRAVGVARRGLFGQAVEHAVAGLGLTRVDRADLAVVTNLGLAADALLVL